MNTWPQLSEPVFGLDNFLIAQRMSALTKDGRVATPEEAREQGVAILARQYAMGERPQEPIRYEDRRG